MKSSILHQSLLILIFCLVNLFCFGQQVAIQNQSSGNFCLDWNSSNPTATFLNYKGEIRTNEICAFSIPDADLPGVGESFDGEKSGIERGAIIGGVAGLLVGSIASAIFNPNEEGSFPIFRAMAGEDVSGEIMEAEVPYIVGGTLIGVAIGAFISHRINRSAMIDKRFDFDFQPEFAFINSTTQKAVLGVRCNMRF